MKKNGMSIVEFSLLVAIGLLIAAISLPAFFQNQQKRRAARCAINLDALAAACRQYAVQSGGFPAQASDLVPTYLIQLPVCPSGGDYQLGTPEGTPPTCSIPGHHLPSTRNSP